MTRALLCAIRLDFAGAFYYHPMFWSLPILAVLFLKDGVVFKNKTLNKVLSGSIFAGFIITWIVRLIIGTEI